MQQNSSPFRQLVTPPKGQRSLEQVDIPAQTRSGGQTTIGIYIETCEINSVRLIVSVGYELVWTERVVGRDHNIAATTALNNANDMIADARFQKDFGLTVELVNPNIPSPAFPAYEMPELSRI